MERLVTATATFAGIAGVALITGDPTWLAMLAPAGLLWAQTRRPTAMVPVATHHRHQVWAFDGVAWAGAEPTVPITFDTAA
ncbi:MAG: hypothetical protein ACI8PZ_001879 [Myxococcota bacterium]|jgi:hypothetical protein